ncbi:FKBP-type peptidyl-prolyl cis-trans isomerase, partial [Neisseria sicca]|uniref:FKBP-type peptidyl-prolyl cis-trans isomerase n=1 Tax=Neisseria sicca TaxID=490 RepID=UPI0034D95B3F
MGVREVIRGWREGIEVLKEGGEGRLYMGWKVGYGDEGVGGGKMGANWSLVLEVKVVKMGKGEEFEGGGGQVEM